MKKSLSVKLMFVLIAFIPGLLKQAYAQAPSNLFSNITIASPNAASLGKYGDYPVSYHTGLPQISIPIYTVKEGALSVPVSLSYHPSGLKVMEPASSVGAGWSLNAGGVITRSVVGAPDDKGYLSNTTHGHFTDYGYNSYLWDTPSGGVGSPTCYSWPEENVATIRDGEFINGHRDGEPDLFFFNFGSYSGKFYFRDDRTPVIVPEEDFKIEPILNAISNFSGFIITTSDGVKYYFGKNQNADGNIDATETTNPYSADNGVSSGNAISSWYLNKIKSGDDLFSIDLIYQAEQYSYYTISMFPVTNGDPLNKHTTLIKNYMNGVRLSQVNFSNGNVKFLPGAIRQDLGGYQTQTITDLANTDSRTLDTIKITDNQNVCKNYVFSYSYFVDNTTSIPFDLSGGLTVTTDTKRLRLDSIQERSCDNTLKIPPYKFSYKTPTTDPSFAPRRLNFAQDHWGFYNGKTANTSLIPAYTVNDIQSYPGADRESSWPEMSYGSLNKVAYPTGGFTNFLFEPNEVWLNYLTYNDSFTAQDNIGPFIGQLGPRTTTLTTTANRYKFILDFKTTNGSNAIRSASIAGISVTKAAPHNEIIITPGVGPHDYILYQNDMITSDWATVNIYEIVPIPFQGNKVVGGLRIKSITNNDGITGKDSATNYNYRSAGKSTGVLYSRPTYVQVYRSEIFRKIGEATLPSTSFYGCENPEGGIGYHKSPSSIRPMATSQGNHIGYNTVEVSKIGNGKTLYSYFGSTTWDQNLSDVSIRNANITTCDPLTPNYPAAPLPFEFIRGELRYEGYYNQTGNLLKEAFYYPVFVDNPISTPAYIAKGSLGSITFYELFTARKTKMTVVNNEYPSAGGTLTNIDSMFYESPYHHQVTRKVSINSVGQKLETKYRYAFDFRVPACEALPDCYQAYTTSYTNALNTFNYKINTCSSSNGCNCKWPAFQSYRYYWSVARKNYVACRRTNYMDASNAFKTNHDNAKATIVGAFKPILELQDQYNNALIEASNFRNGQLLNANFYRFDYSTNPTNKVYPIKTQSISIAASSATFTPAAVNATGDALAKDSRYKDEVLYKFLSGNPAEITSKAGITVSNLWGYNNTLPVAQIIGATSDQISYTSFESNNTGNFTYATTRTADMTSATGNYCYDLSLGAVQRIGLNAASTYILSYWYKTINATNPSIVTSGTQSNYVTGPTRNGWVLKQMQFTGSTTVDISGTGYIDEIRMCPIGAQMTTYTYSPLVGITSTNDANNKITYYQYDNLNRLKNIRDQDRNITKNFFYNYGLSPNMTPTLISFYATNTITSDYAATFTSKTTGQVFKLPNFSIGNNILVGNIPPDIYDISIKGIGGSVLFQTRLCNLTKLGPVANYYNISVNGSMCNSLIVEPFQF